MPKYFDIDAAFCSEKTNECYIFVKDKYVVLNYAPGGKKNCRWISNVCENDI
jgi:hypothetical protein